MKLIFGFLLLFVFTANATLSRAQNLNLSLKNVSLKEVFREIQKQTNYDILYVSKDLEKCSSVNIQRTNLGIRDCLDLILKDQPLVYEINNKAILISAKPINKSIKDNVQQSIVIRGKVTDAKGAPLAGTIVNLKGSESKVVTGANGNYMISVPSQESSLVYSFIGFETKEVKVGQQRSIDISMVPQEKMIDELVVIGYGTVNKGDITGAVGTANVKEMEKAPVANFDQALAGRVAGVQVSNNDGQPGQNANIVIRGGNSLTQSSAPLYVVDGFPMEDFSSSALSNFDIASISILKDASATAIYGARGANGVVVIETKKGQIGKASIDLSASYGVQSAIKKMDLMSGYEFVKYQNEIYPSLANSYYLGAKGKTLDDYASLSSLDMQDKLFRTSPIGIYNLAIRGGSVTTKYSISGSIYDQEGIIVNSSNKRYVSRLALDQTLSNKFKAGVVVGISQNNVDGTPLNTGPTSSATSYTLYRTWGFRPVTSSDINLADLLIDPESEGLNLMVNPVISLENEVYSNNFLDLNLNAYLTYEILKGLTFKVTAGTNNRKNQYKYFFNSNTYRATPRNPSNFRGTFGGIINRSQSGWLNENTLQYKKYFNKNHVLDVLGGVTFQRRDMDSFGFEGDNIQNEEMLFSSLGGSTPYSNSSSQSYHTLASFLGRINYSLYTKYLFTASFRADGSSKFIESNRWGYFPSFALAWKLKEENFLKNIDLISDAKVRVGYGVTGNNRVGDFDRAAGMVYADYNAGYAFDGELPSKGLIQNSMGNKSLKWETTAQSNLGIDIGLFKNRIQFTADLYQKNTKDLLLLAKLPRTTGFVREYRNIGEIRNKGLELTVNASLINKKNFSWESNFNIAFNKNSVLSLVENESNILTSVAFDNNFTSSSPYIAMLDGPAALYYGYIWDGNYQFSDFNEVSPGNYVLRNDVTTNGGTRGSIKPGDIKYRDINGDLVVNGDDLAVIGNPQPLHVGGFNNTFLYKNLELSVLFQWSYGNDLLNANRLIFEGNGLFRPLLNQFASYENRWTPENQNNELFRSGGHGPFGAYSSRVIEDGSYLRLKTLSMSYKIPERLLSKIFVSNLALTVSGQNLITWTNYSGMDPEVSTRHSALTPGFDYSAYPIARTIVFGINAKF